MNKGKIQSFSDLNSWKKSHQLIIKIYKITEGFPAKENFCLTSQIRRAAISVSSNIAEGFSKPSYKEKSKFYSISLGSLTETQNQLLIARDLGYINEAIFNKLAKDTIFIHKLLNGLIKKSNKIHYKN